MALGSTGCALEFTVLRAHCSEQQRCVEIAQSLRFSTSGRCHQRADWKAILVVVPIIVLTAAGIV